MLTRKLATILLKPLSDYPYQTIVLSGSSFGDAASNVAGPLLLTLARKQCLHTVILSDILASLPADEALRSLSSIASSIGTYKRLRAVDLSHNAVGTMGMAHCAPLLQGQALLEVVNLEDTGLSADAARLLCEYLTTTAPTALRGLNVHGNRLDSDGMQHIASIVSKSPNLQCLRASSVGASSNAVTALANSLANTSDIRELDISDNGFDNLTADSIADSLVKQSNLVRLVLSDLNMTDTGLHGVLDAVINSGAPLSELRVSGNELGPGAAEDISRLLTASSSRLVILDISSNELGDNGIRHLADALKTSDSSQLQNLYVAENNASTASIIHLSSCLVRLPHFVRLDFMRNELPLAVSRRIASVFPPTVVVLDDDDETDVDADAETELADEPVDDDEEMTSQRSQRNGSEEFENEIEIALQALESVAKNERASNISTDPSSPRSHSDVARLVSFFSKNHSATPPIPNPQPVNDALQTETSSDIESAHNNPDASTGDLAESHSPPLPPLEDIDPASIGTDDGAPGTPPSNRFHGSIASPITPQGDASTNVLKTDNSFDNNINASADNEKNDDDNTTNENVVLSARKLKESIVSLSKEISDVAGELQMPETPELQDDCTNPTHGNNADDDVGAYLLVGREEEQEKGAPYITMVVDCAGGCLVALFVVVIVLAIAQSQEESTFSFRPL